MLSVRHPPSWMGDQAEREGVWYRYFQAPPQGDEVEPGVTAMLLAGPLTSDLPGYAEGWIQDAPVSGVDDVERGGTAGRLWRFGTEAEPQTLLLLEEGARVFGLHVRGTGAAWERDAAAIAQMNASLTLERPASYPRESDEDWGYSLGVPESWRATRRMASGQNYLRQYQSPALGADRDSGTVHAFLSLTIEPVGGDGSVGAFYDATLARLGEAHRVLWHGPWRDGFADTARSETQLASSRMRRYYLAAGGRGYCLSCESREDVFHRAQGWCEVIASTLEVTGGESR